MDFYLQTPPVDPGVVQDFHSVQWFPLQSLLDNYNNRVKNELHLPAQFQLEKSPSILDLENGVHHSLPLEPVEHWDAYVSFRGQEKPWADVQVNYQLSVRTLSDNLDAWIRSWSSIWAQSVVVRDQDNRHSVQGLDSDIGDARDTPTKDIYRTQTYAAMWRRAKDQVDAHFKIPTSAGLVTPLIRGLLTYLLVASSVSISTDDASTSKNLFPQLPKTSPVSIAREILALHRLVHPATALTAPLAPFYAQLAQLEGPPVGPPIVTMPRGATAAPLPVDRARLIALEELRRYTSLTGPPRQPTHNTSGDHHPAVETFRSLFP